jgi:hypothetical protein
MRERAGTNARGLTPTSRGCRPCGTLIVAEVDPPLTWWTCLCRRVVALFYRVFAMGSVEIAERLLVVRLWLEVRGFRGVAYAPRGPSTAFGWRLTSLRMTQDGALCVIREVVSSSRCGLFRSMSFSIPSFKNLSSCLAAFRSSFRVFGRSASPGSCTTVCSSTGLRERRCIRFAGKNCPRGLRRTKSQ